MFDQTQNTHAPAAPAGYIAQSAGLLTTDASRASFLSTFTVLVVPFLAGISGKGVSIVTWASCIAAVMGVGLLEQSGAAPGVGDVWSMVSAVAFGIQASASLLPSVPFCPTPARTHTHAPQTTVPTHACSLPACRC